jgi:hypothetical protein
MRKAAAMVVTFGLIALCIYTSALRGKLWRTGEEIEQRVQEQLLIESRIRNLRAVIRRQTSVPQLAKAVRGEEERPQGQLARAGGRR